MNTNDGGLRLPGLNGKPGVTGAPRNSGNIAVTPTARSDAARHDLRRRFTHSLSLGPQYERACADAAHAALTAQKRRPNGASLSTFEFPWREAAVLLLTLLGATFLIWSGCRMAETVANFGEDYERQLKRASD